MRTVARHPFCLTSSDLNGDGALDLVVGGKFKERTSAHFDLPSDPTTAAAFGDIDADGDLDLVVGSTDNSIPGSGAERVFIQVHNGHGHGG